MHPFVSWPYRFLVSVRHANGERADALSEVRIPRKEIGERLKPCFADWEFSQEIAKGNKQSGNVSPWFSTSTTASREFDPHFVQNIIRRHPQHPLA
jgi:hypothetical protein